LAGQHIDDQGKINMGKQPKKRSRVQKPKFVKPTRISSKNPVARKKGKHKEAGEWETRIIYLDPQRNEFADPDFTQPVQPIDLVDWEEDGPKQINGETGAGVQRYKRFKPYDPPLGGGMA
jgi:hypothetical protein